MTTRDPLSGRLVTLIGGSGFIGRHIAQALLARGARLRIASRNPEKGFVLKPLANLGQLQFARSDVTKPGSVAAALEGADAVVNLAAAWGREGPRIIADGAANVAEAAAARGIADVVLVSSIGADPEGLTGFARDKAAAEARTLAAVPSATILRPSVVFGADDKFITMFARLIANLPALPVFAPEAPMQIVYVDDVAAAVATVLGNRAATAGKTYELGGPEKLSVIDINRAIARAQGRERAFLPLPDALSAMISRIPFGPITHDQWLMLSQGNVVAKGAAGFAKLGIEPRPLGLFLDRWMVPYRKHGRFTEAASS